MKEKMVKVKRVNGPQKSARSEFDIFVYDEELYNKYVNFEVFEVPESYVVRIHGILPYKEELEEEPLVNEEKVDKRKKKIKNNKDIGE